MIVKKHAAKWMKCCCGRGGRKQYGKDPFVRSAMQALAKGKFVRKIDSTAWKIVIWCGSVLFSFHAYSLMAAGIALLRMLQVDSKITKARYRKVQ